MPLGGFVVAQLVLDVVLVVALLVLLARRSAPAPPPAWHGELVALAGDLLAASSPVLDVLESHAASPSDRHREARALLRAGASADEVARQLGLGPLEMRLLTAVAAAPDPVAP